MHSTWKTLAISAGLGFVSGVRTFTGLATASWHLSRQGRSHSGSTVLTAQSSKVRLPLTVLAGGEIVLDKTPFVGNRTDPPALFGRAAFGALCGVLVADYLRTDKIAAAAVGAASAVASTFIAFHARKAATERMGVPDWMVAVAEDAAAVSAASSLLHGLRK